MRPIFQLLLTVFLATAAFTSGAQTTETPFQFNAKLVAVSDTLYRSGQAWGRAFSQAYQNGDYSGLKPHRQQMMELVEAKLKYVTALKDVKNSKPLRQAYLDFLNFEKKMITEAFVPFESLPAGASREEVQKLLEKLKELSVRESGVMAMLDEAQKRYATENGFAIEGDE